MKIPNKLDPQGTIKKMYTWEELDMSSFKKDVWYENELTPLGYPNGGYVNGRNCTRSNLYEMLFFGFNYRQTTQEIQWFYCSSGGKAIHVPPRGEGLPWAAPLLEFWNLGKPQILRITFTMSRKPVFCCSTNDNMWNTWTQLEVIENEDGTYTVETPYCKSVALSPSVYYSLHSGTITKIERLIESYV